MRWQEIHVDDATRGFVTQLTDLVIDTEWRNMKSINKWVGTSHKESEIDWREVWKDISKVKGRKCTSSQAHKDWIFKIKRLNGLLPTMQVLKQRKGDLYTNDTCKICSQECETQDHLAECTELQLTWSKLEEEGCSAIVNKAGKEKANLKTYNKQKIAELVFGKSLDEKISTRKELIKGIVTKQRVQKISSLLEEEVAKTSKILHAFIDSFSHHFC